MTFTLLLCVLLMQDRRHPFPELPRLIKPHLTKFTFKKKSPNLPPFPLLCINTFQSLKFIASHLPFGKRKKKKKPSNFLESQKKVLILTEMVTNDGENLWTKYEPEQNQQKPSAN